MKTFETEKNNIPEGATHYCDEVGIICFTWLRWDNEVLMALVPEKSHGWNGAGIFTDHYLKKMKPIPKPEVVEWKNGDECRYNGINWLFCGFHPVNGLAIVANNDEPSYHQVITVDVELLSKPESPEEKEQRERLEAAYDLYCEAQKAVGNLTIVTYEKFASNETVNLIFWLAIVDKTNYRKGE